jgi:3-methyl-2-oxobutanoate hydroxymethyltransferase
VQGRGQLQADRLSTDAAAIAEAGAFSIVIEGTVEPVARGITKAVSVPTIGIGASPICDGQILVTDDVLGLFTQFKPRFVRRYAELAPLIAKAAGEYAQDVRARRFPGPEHCFGIE